jgi:hypothetical protein
LITAFPFARLGLPVEGIHLSLDDRELRAPFDPFSPSWASWTFEPIEDPERNAVSLFLFLSHISQTARDMLMFLGANGPSWVTLYALKDFMEKGGWSEKDMAVAAKVQKSELVRFRATANNHSALGPFARHGEVGWAPPASPMKHAEAIALVLTCVGAFLREEAIKQNIKATFAAMTI